MPRRKLALRLLWTRRTIWFSKRPIVQPSFSDFRRLVTTVMEVDTVWSQHAIPLSAQRTAPGAGVICCSYCGKLGHRERDCFRRRRAQLPKGQAEDSWRQKSYKAWSLPTQLATTNSLAPNPPLSSKSQPSLSHVPVIVGGFHLSALLDSSANVSILGNNLVIPLQACYPSASSSD